MTAVITSSILPTTASTEKASRIATTQTTGTGAAMVKVITSVCCTTFTSDRVRVIIEAAPKRPNSEAESSRLWR